MNGRRSERVRKNERRVYVLDTFALLAYFQNEVSADQISEVLVKAGQGQATVWLSIISYGETLYIIERRRGLKGVHQIIAVIDQLPISLVEADRRHTFLAAHIKARYTLSYADAFAVALAQVENAIVLTGDIEFKEVESFISIEWLTI
jgi:predicted nucleic acid-binding protein